MRHRRRGPRIIHTPDESADPIDDPVHSRAALSDDGGGPVSAGRYEAAFLRGRDGPPDSPEFPVENPASVESGMPP